MSEKTKESRRESRQMAVEVLFSYLARNQSVSLKETLAHVLEVEGVLFPEPFLEELLNTTVKHLGKIKLILKVFAPEFPFEKIAPINRAILILGICEMKFLDTPPIVVINEYIELAKQFGEEKSAGFINAVLDSFRRQIGKERQEQSLS